jgi:hypothetical protein
VGAGGVPVDPRAQRGDTARMFERFTDRARRVVMLAQEESRRLNHNYIGTEHILLGLVREGEGVAAQALASLDVALDAVRSQVEEIIGYGGTAPSGHIPFTPRAKKVLELSLREALHLGHNYIGTEHILLGLVREGEGVAAQVLVKLGADLSRVHQAVVNILGGQPVGHVVAESSSFPGRARGACSFCKRGLGSVGRYLAAPGAVICERCVTLAADELQREPEVRVLRPPPEVAGDPPDLDAVAVIVSAVRAVFSEASDDGTRAAALEDGERLGPLYLQARGRSPNLGQDYVVERVRFIRPDVADIHLVVFGGEYGTDVAATFDGPVVHLAGRWKVGRELICPMIRFAGLECPPTPAS